MKLELRTIEPAGDIAECMAIRIAVFVDEQAVPVAIEHDEWDARAVHVLASADGQPVATGRCYFPEPGSAKVGRMAVLLAFRLQGIGSAVLDVLELEARLRGADVATLHAQLSARDFYSGNGYVPEGEVFDEAGIPHITMRKRLTEFS